MLDLLITIIFAVSLLLFRECLPFYYRAIKRLDACFNSSPDNSKAIIETMNNIK